MQILKKNLGLLPTGGFKMMITNITQRFLDNALNNKANRIIVFHWTGSHTAKSAIDWLDQRNEGNGSVGYNFIIDKDGVVYMLADPLTHWMHNTGLGTNFDEKTISISLASFGMSDPFTDKQIESSKGLVQFLEKRFNIIKTTHHAHLNKNKQDFPKELWDSFSKKILI